MNHYTPQDEKHLIDFLKFVDNSTYLLDGQRYYISDNEKISEAELANIFLQSDLYEG